MSRTQFVSLMLLCVSTPLFAQQKRMDQDPKLNNLVHAKGYVTCALGTLGRVTKVGTGPQDMILIAGAGFGGDIFDGYMQEHQDKYTMHAVTLPGFGRTAAPPMPRDSVSYSEQTWMRSSEDPVGLAVIGCPRTRLPNGTRGRDC